jgi:hypothetical protein
MPAEGKTDLKRGVEVVDGLGGITVGVECEDVSPRRQRALVEREMLESRAKVLQARQQGKHKCAPHMREPHIKKRKQEETKKNSNAQAVAPTTSDTGRAGVAVAQSPRTAFWKLRPYDKRVLTIRLRS